MRRRFAKLLHEEMQNNERIHLISIDLGYGMWDNIKNDFPLRFHNSGAAEMLGVGMAIGMSYENIIPIVFSITPFLIYRPFETLRTYLNHEKTNVKLLGSGRDFDYEHDSISHFAHDAKEIISTLKNISQFWPNTEEELKEQIQSFIYDDGPSFMSLSRKIIF